MGAGRRVVNFACSQFVCNIGATFNVKCAFLLFCVWNDVLVIVNRPLFGAVSGSLV